MLITVYILIYRHKVKSLQTTYVLKIRGLTYMRVIKCWAVWLSGKVIAGHINVKLV